MLQKLTAIYMSSHHEVFNVLLVRMNCLPEFYQHLDIFTKLCIFTHGPHGFNTVDDYENMDLFYESGQKYNASLQATEQ